jgi:hypothetical protein
MKRNAFAVKHGRIMTTFEHALSARSYWEHTVGGVLMVRNAAGKWVRL